MDHGLVPGHCRMLGGVCLLDVPGFSGCHQVGVCRFGGLSPRRVGRQRAGMAVLVLVQGRGGRHRDGSAGKPAQPAGPGGPCLSARRSCRPDSQWSLGGLRFYPSATSTGASSEGHRRGRTGRRRRRPESIKCGRAPCSHPDGGRPSPAVIEANVCPPQPVRHFI